MNTGKRLSNSSDGQWVSVCAETCSQHCL